MIDSFRPFDIYDFDSVIQWIHERVAKENRGLNIYESPSDNTINCWIYDAIGIGNLIRKYVGIAQSKAYDDMVYDLQVEIVESRLKAYMDGFTSGFITRSNSAEQAHHTMIAALTTGVLAVNKGE